ncbi:hypothetical protein Pmani_007527 [Petrolisthes manimaculis]|uniref:Uncharacterized protein n=1 Tax=Petrolisthes manimaculis TaxID=1843537 RepID=A0AAE1UK19_9EUCA|nr:hypothetical protein Pmani_007527 [Petrolisthes manimaculis]
MNKQCQIQVSMKLSGDTEPGTASQRNLTVQCGAESGAVHGDLSTCSLFQPATGSLGGLNPGPSPVSFRKDSGKSGRSSSSPNAHGLRSGPA